VFLEWNGYIMKVDIEDVLFWMDAIRNSTDKYRTLESFWKGQVRSKIWLINNLSEFITEPVSITIYGGWNGVLANLIFNSNIPVKHITSVDIDPTCEETANTINKRYQIDGKFLAVTADMCGYETISDVVINTSCEHITQEQYDLWITKVPKSSIVVLQSNNYDIPEHIRIVDSIDNFIPQSNLSVLQASELELPLYKRFMIIGKR